MSEENDNPVDFPTDVETVEMAEAALTDAKSALEQKDEQLTELEEANAELSPKADALEQIAAAHDMPVDGEEFSPAAIVDEHTDDLRREVAEREAALAAYETSGDNLDDRVGELCGKSPQYLESRAGTLAREQMNVQADQASHSNALVSGGEGTEYRSEGGSASGMNDEERVEEMADAVLDFEEAARARQANMNPSTFVKDEYGVEASDYQSEMALGQAISTVRRNGGEN